MESFSRIIVAVDGSRGAQRAIDVAAALARQWDLPVTLVTAVTSDDAIERERDRLAVAALEFSGDVLIEVRRGRSTRTQLMAALRHDRGGVGVVATHAQHPVAELLLGSVADDLVRRSPRPMVLVGPQVGPPTADGYADLLLCLDGSARSEHLVPLVERAKSELNMRPHIVEVVAPGRAPADGGDVAQLVRRLAASGVEAEHLVVTDDRPAHGIIGEAGRHASALIAIATEGRDPFARLRQSSTAIAVTRSASCPVLVLGPMAVDRR